MRAMVVAITAALVLPYLGAPAAGADPQPGERWLAQQREAAPDGALTAWWAPQGNGHRGGAPPAEAEAHRPARDRSSWLRRFADAGGPAAPARSLAQRLQAAGVAFAQGGGYAPGRGLARFDRVIDAGDLDGDGGRDALVSGRVLNEDRFAVRAVSGRDGAELWAATSVAVNIPTLIPLAPAGGDVLEVSCVDQGVHYEGDCSSAGCSEVRDHTFLWAVRLVEGTTGEMRWQVLVPGTQRDAYDNRNEVDGSYSSISTVDRVDRDLLVLPAGDLDGDGSGDFVLQRTSGQDERGYENVAGSPGVPAASSEYGRVRNTVLIETLSGVDGSVLARTEIADVAAVLTPSAGADVDGDGRPEVALTHVTQPDWSYACDAVGCTEDPGAPSVAVALLDGATLAQRWRTDVPGLAFGAVDPARPDLDGDGGTDLLVSDTGPYCCGQGTFTALAGSSGAVLWRTEPRAIAAVLTAPLDADADDDVLLAAYGDPYATGELLAVERLDGTTGQVLLRTAVRTDFDPCCEYAYLQLSLPGDAGGDAVPDLALGLAVYDAQTGVETARTTVESGRPGAALWSRDGLLAIVPGGDLDGDGGTDGLVQHFDRLEAVALRDGTTLWEQPAPLPWDSQLRRGGDQDGDGDEELLVLTSTYDGGYHATELSSLDGRDGTTRWSYPPPAEAPTVGRLTGTDRVATAMAVSRATFDAAGAAVLARADHYPDALAGGPLAATLGGPLLLTPADALDPRVGAELERLGVEHVVLLGGQAALAPAPQADLESRGLAVDRLAGADRFETAALVADRMVEAGGDPTEVLLAEGIDPDPLRGWPDALSAAAFGAVLRAPVLLTDTDMLPAATAGALARLGTRHVRVVGGAPAVAEAVVAELEARGLTTERLEGASRFATTRVVADAAAARGADPGRVYVATGGAFPDALAASAAIGATGGVLLLVGGPEGAGASDALSFLRAHRSHLQEVHILGGPEVVSTRIEEELRQVTANP